jgi:hypothetical protein
MYLFQFAVSNNNMIPNELIFSMQQETVKFNSVGIWLIDRIWNLNDR